MAQSSTKNPMISCKIASELIDRKSTFKLSIREKIALKIHLAICEACRQYEKQSQLLDEFLKSHLTKSTSEEIPQQTNEILKDKILETLKKNR